MASPDWNKVPKVSRDTVLFVAGLLGAAHETLVSKAERPSLLALFAGMLGLPLFLRKDEKDRQEEPPAEDKGGMAPDGEG